MTMGRHMLSTSHMLRHLFKEPTFHSGRFITLWIILVVSILHISFISNLLRAIISSWKNNQVSQSALWLTAVSISINYSCTSLIYAFILCGLETVVWLKSREITDSSGYKCCPFTSLVQSYNRIVTASGSHHPDNELRFSIKIMMCTTPTC